MPNFQDNFKTRKQSFNSAFSISMTVPLTGYSYKNVAFRTICSITLDIET